MRRRFFCLLGVAALFACSDGTGPKPVASVDVLGAPASLQVGASATLSAQAKDADGAILTGRTFTWSTSTPGIVGVTPAGVVSALATGQAVVNVAADGKTGTVSFAVIPVPVAMVTVTLGANQIGVGATTQASAALTDGAGRPLTGRQVAWSSSQPSVAAVDGNGLVTGVSPGGPVTISAVSEGVTGTATITVTSDAACAGGTFQMVPGEARSLTGAARSSFCLGGGANSEFVLIPFNASTTAASMAPVSITGSGALSAASPELADGAVSLQALHVPPAASAELQFRIRERHDLNPLMASRANDAAAASAFSMITGIPANPAVGEVYPINTNITGNTCTAAKVLKDARVVAVTTKIIVMIDVTSPSGGYSDSEMSGFAQTFESLGYGVDTLNFGAPSDTDQNGKIVMLFTPAVNALSTEPNVIVGGLQASRDLFPVSVCAGSNEGEMFYLPVPDPSSTINGSYTDKGAVSRGLQGTMAHEFQHLINAGRRIYVNNASAFEEIWLNEGLSHVAEELAYYRASANNPRTNVDLPRVQSSQVQLDAINGYQVSNLGRLRIYMGDTESSSPYAQNDDLETRGAIWQLLRYAADRLGGNETTTWMSLVNSTRVGQANFAGVFGSFIPVVRDWVITQYLDDFGAPSDPIFQNPSWNFRSLLPAINQGTFPLVTRTLSAGTLELTLAGGGASYIRFSVPAGSTAGISASSSGQQLLPQVDLIVVRSR